MEQGSGLRLCGQVLFLPCAHAREALTPGVSDSHASPVFPTSPDTSAFPSSSASMQRLGLRPAPGVRAGDIHVSVSYLF